MNRSRTRLDSHLTVTKPDAAAIGARIRRVRGIANQLEFAARLGISREQLSRIESGANVPGTPTLRRLARVAGVSLDFIVLGADFAAPQTGARGTGSGEASLEALLGGTPLRLPRASAASGRKIDRAWQALSEERREEVRDFVRRIALVAVASEASRPAKAARPSRTNPARSSRRS